MKNKFKIPLQFFAEGGKTTPPEGDPGNTQPPAERVDIDSIVSQASAKAIEVSEQKMQAVFKSMLKQEGVDTETIKSLTDDWKAKNKPPETTPPEESEAYKDLIKRLDGLEGKYSQSQTELNSRKQMDYLENAKIPEELIDYYQFKINQLVSETVFFEEAAAQYIKDNPPQVKPPEFATGGGKAIATATEAEKIKNDYVEAQKNKNHAEMSRITRLAHQKGVQLY